MAKTPEIMDAFAEFDGRHVAPLKALVATGPEVEAVLEHLPGPHEVAASWVMKALVERGAASEAELAGFLELLPLLAEPDAILHLLQCVRFAPVAVARALRGDLVPFFAHKRGLIRVWAFDAYLRGAELPGELADTRERLGQGLVARDAAMRARARGLAVELGIEVE